MVSAYNTAGGCVEDHLPKILKQFNAQLMLDDLSTRRQRSRGSFPADLRTPIQKTSVALTAAAIVACGGGESPTPPVARPPFSIVAGNAVSDSIQARLAQPLMVEVRTTSGAPRTGVAISFVAMPPTDTSRRAERAIVVAPRTTALFAGQATDTTDAQGRAGVLVQLGTVAGSAAVAIRTADGLTDTARFTVTPGNVVKLSMAFRDTTLMANESLDHIATMLDRFGNAPNIAASLTLTSLIDAAVTLTASGGAKATGTFGRARIGVQAAGKTDSAFISVVPAATIVYVDNDLASMFTARLNGTVLRKFSEYVNETHAAPFSIDWDPSGAGRFVIAADQAGIYQALFMVDTSGSYRAVEPFSYEPAIGTAHFSSDGQWVYYSKAYHSKVTGQIDRYELYRIHPDGAGAERVYSPPTGSTGYWNPVPIPGGRYVIATGWNAQQNWSTARLDVTTGETVQYGPYFNASYCAASDLVAMTAQDGRLWVVKSDGTGLRALPPMPGTGSGNGTYSPPGWSPDCAWMLAVNEKNGRPVAIRLSDGAIVPITVGSRPYDLTWKP